MGRKVVIVGGGIAGLTAAHELIERGFEVLVCERRTNWGGKAASRLASAQTTADADASRWQMTCVAWADTHNLVPPAARKPPVANNMPMEHGFRFFPSWYRHLIDTMKRIPYKGRRREYQGASVFNNLVPAEQNVITWARRSPVHIPLRIPTTLNQLGAAAGFLQEYGKMGVGVAECLDFFAKLAHVLAADDDEHLRLQQVTWWDFVGAEKKSKSFQEFMRATTMTLVAAKADQVNADTIGKLAIRTLLGSPLHADGVLNGPTQEKFIQPWYDYLEGRSVRFSTGFELDSFEFAGGEPKIKAVVLRRTAADTIARLRAVLRMIKYDVGSILKSTRGVPSESARERARANCGSAQGLLGQALDLLSSSGGEPFRDRRPALLDLWPLIELEIAILESMSAPAGTPVAESMPNLEMFFGVTDLRAMRDSAERKRVLERAEILFDEVEASTTVSEEVDFLILALPVEQLAYYVNRSGTLRSRAPELASIVPLADHTSWMAGIQFYLKEPFDFVRGHIVGMDAPWGITLLEQTQFWKDTVIHPDVKAVLSVDVGEWSKRGQFVEKPAWNCREGEIALEIWEQLKRLINPEDRQPKLRDDMLFSTPGSTGRPQLLRGINFNIDDSIADILDRKKQDAYERARSVALGREDVTPSETGAAGMYMWGRRNNYNIEPILVNRVGSQTLRPDVTTSVQNLFLAADYVKTETDLACMEGANEAARRAVNALLETTGSQEPPCELWDFKPLSHLAEQLTSLAGVETAGKPLAAVARSATDAASGLVGLAARTLGRVLGTLERSK
jgi:uncharacterized protein with NAD-binding domain and iron-sulfur cluster